MTKSPLEAFDEAWSDAGETYPNRKQRVLAVFNSAIAAAEKKGREEAWRDAEDSLFNNPYEEWDEKVGKTREREKRLWAGWDEAREKIKSAAKEEKV